MRQLILFLSVVNLGISIGHAQSIDYNDSNGLQFGVVSKSSLGVLDNEYGYHIYQQEYQFALALGGERSSLFDYKKILMHSELEKAMRTKTTQFQFYGSILNKYLQFEEDQCFQPGLKLGIRGFQYRMIHSYLMYDMNYVHFSSNESTDRGVNLFRGQIGMYSVRNMSMGVYLGLYTIMGEKVKLMIPLLGLRIKSSNKWETQLLVPVELKVTRKWKLRKFWTDVRLYVNGNITDFGKKHQQQGIDGLQIMNLHFGARQRYALNDLWRFNIESGWEFYNQVTSYTLDDYFGTSHTLPSRFYLNIGIEYSLKGNNGIGNLFEFY